MMENSRMPGSMNYLIPEQKIAKQSMGMYYLQMANHMNHLDSMHRVYPDAYKRMMPYVDRALDEIDDPSALTEADMSRITRDIVHKSNILSDPPVGHNETTLKDLAGVMILASLFDGDDNPFLLPYTLPFLLPYGRRHRSSMRRFYL